MKHKGTVFLIVLFVSSLACQFGAPSRPGIRISDCSEVVLNIRTLQSSEIPEHLLMTGEKRGDEFDVNHYFDVLNHISMQEGYALDYVYQNDGLGGYPLLYARPVNQVPFASTADIPEGTEWPNFQLYLEVKDTEQGYFEYVVMDLLANQFYLFWHANYNDALIVCNRQQVYEVVAQVNSGDFGNIMDKDQQARARTLRDIVPVVRLTGDVAVVEVVTFTKWGGFYRYTYTISRETPHTIIDIEQENILPYDCGVMF
jgi:hypothetical protein